MTIPLEKKYNIALQLELKGTWLDATYAFNLSNGLVNLLSTKILFTFHIKFQWLSLPAVLSLLSLVGIKYYSGIQTLDHSKVVGERPYEFR